MKIGIYTHPYKREFTISATREGFVSLQILFWKRELWANVHSIGPGIDYILAIHLREIEKLQKQYVENVRAVKPRLPDCSWSDYC